MPLSRLIVIIRGSERMSSFIACHYCPEITFLTEEGARFEGWRIFKGVSLTGKRLDDVICPNCSGRGELRAKRK